MKPSHLFHVTPIRNSNSIDLHGIDSRIAFPERTTQSINYFVSAAALGWAIAHTSDRHSVPVASLLVYRIETPDDAKKFFGKGIYTISCRPVYVPVMDAGKSARYVLSAMSRGVSLVQPELFAHFDTFEEISNG